MSFLEQAQQTYQVARRQYEEVQNHLHALTRLVYSRQVEMQILQLNETVTKELEQISRLRRLLIVVANDLKKSYRELLSYNNVIMTKHERDAKRQGMENLMMNVHALIGELTEMQKKGSQQRIMALAKNIFYNNNQNYNLIMHALTTEDQHRVGLEVKKLVSQGRPYFNSSINHSEKPSQRSPASRKIR